MIASIKQYKCEKNRPVAEEQLGGFCIADLTKVTTYL